MTNVARKLEERGERLYWLGKKRIVFEIGTLAEQVLFLLRHDDDYCHRIGCRCPVCDKLKMIRRIVNRVKKEKP